MTLDNIISESKRRQELEKSIFDNDVYIDWLERFLSIEKGYFTSNLNNSKLSDEEAQKAKDIDILYFIIEEYARNNFIEPLEDKNNSKTISYGINGKKLSYIIGIWSFDGIIEFFISRRSQNENFINFSDIQKNVASKKAQMIKKMLEDFNNQVTYLQNMGVPDYAIEETVSKNLKLKKPTRR